jgi:type I restriction enzyme S subunit
VGSQGRAICSNFITRLRPRNGYDPHFLAHVFAGIYDRGQTVPFIKQSTGIQNLDADAFLSQRWAVPPLGDQIAISQRIDDSHERATLAKRMLTDQVNLLIEHRQALIAAAVTGELDIQRIAA